MRVNSEGVGSVAEATAVMSAPPPHLSNDHVTDGRKAIGQLAPRVRKTAHRSWRRTAFLADVVRRLLRATYLMNLETQ